MGILEVLSLLFVLAVLAGLTLMANFADRQRRLYHMLVIGGISVINILLILNTLLLIAVENTDSEIITDDVENVGLAIIISIITAGLATLLLFTSVRHAIRSWFPQRIDDSAATDEGADVMHYGPLMSDGEVILTPPVNIQPASQSRTLPNELLGFDPRSTMHMLALVFCIYLIGTQLVSFALGGGLSGVAEDTEVNAAVLLMNFIPMVIIPLLGVGIFIRRSGPEVLERLGLESPSMTSVGVGVAAAIALIFVVFALTIAWLIVVGEETFEQQNEASDAITQSINTIWLALGVAVTAAIGEEIAFRGALQPIFGLWWTAIIFTATHIQYTLTPAALIIFVVAIGLGWLRRRFDLYAAIAAHFVYNFIPLLLQLLL